MAARLRITLKRSLIGRPENQRATVRGLGLRRLNHTVERPDNPAVRGMIRKVRHLVAVEESVEEATQYTVTRRVTLDGADEAERTQAPGQE